jgi:hypothetical protein
MGAPGTLPIRWCSGSIRVTVGTYPTRPWKTDGVAEAEDPFVDPRQMRQGIASALVLGVSSRLHLLGFERVEVTAEPHAMTFYEYVGSVAHQIVDAPGYPAPRMSRPTSSPD